jgi:hypothetical protein
MPNSQDSTAFVYLDNDGLPDIVAWPADFAQIANAVHRLRGVEVNIEGLVKDLGGDTLIPARGWRQALGAASAHSAK